MNGVGTMKWGDGREYTGPWVNNKRDGDSGKMMWPNGDKYIGSFKDDMRNGNGEAISIDGSRY